MNYRIAICDDEHEQIEYLRGIIADWSENSKNFVQRRGFSQCGSAFVRI